MQRSVLVEVNKFRLGEVWDKQLSKWDTVSVEKIDAHGETADLLTYDGDTLLDVPVDSFKVIGPPTGT